MRTSVPKGWSPSADNKLAIPPRPRQVDVRVEPRDSYDRHVAPLPQPGSDALVVLVPNAAVRVVYEVLYEHREAGLTMLELRALATPRLHALGLTDQQEQLDRRKRDLHAYLRVP